MFIYILFDNLTLVTPTYRTTPMSISLLFLFVIIIINFYINYTSIRHPSNPHLPTDSHVVYFISTFTLAIPTYFLVYLSLSLALFYYSLVSYLGNMASSHCALLNQQACGTLYCTQHMAARADKVM